MADLNALIAQGAQFAAPPDPFAQYGKMQQLQQGETANQLNRMKMDEYQRSLQEQNALRNLDPAAADYLTQIKKVNPKLGFEFEKATNEAANLKFTGIKTQTDIAKTKRDMLDSSLRNMASNPSNENIIAHAQDYALNPMFTDDLPSIQANAQKLLAMTPDQRKAVLSGAGATARDLKPPAPPASVAEFERAQKDPKFMKFLQDRAAATRAPVQPVAPTITQIVDPANPNQMITIDARRYQGGNAGSLGVIGVAGKEPGAALRTNKVEAGKSQLADDLDNLRFSFQTLDELRAIPSTERNVVSNLMSASAASGLGQTLGRAGGSPEQVERDVINSARQRLVNSIKNATGMSAQLLNSNVELQTMLKSISDPGQSIQAAIRIIDDIENAYVKGNGTLPKRNMPSGAPAAASNVVVTPDGQSHTFPTPAAAAQFKKAAGIQ